MKEGEKTMKVYTGNEDADHVQDLFFWWKNVTNKAIGVTIWFGGFCAWSEFGLGYVDLATTDKDGYVISLETRRCYGPIVIKFKEAEK